MSGVIHPTSGGAGLKVFKATAQKATATAVQTSRGRVYGYHIYNPDSTDTFVQFFDAAAANVTVGTTVSTFTLWVPALSGIDAIFTVPVEFNTACTLAATTTATGSTAPTTGVLINVFYV